MNTLLAPELTRGRGTGHLRRCVRLMGELPEAVLLVPAGGEGRRGGAELNPFVDQVPAGRIVREAAGEWKTVVLDRFHATREEVLAFGNSLTVGLDPGGPGRDYCSYVVDTLPRADNSPANCSDASLLHLPEDKPLPEGAAGRFLVTLGGEDPALLTEETVRALVGAGVDPFAVTVVRPFLRALGTLPPGVTVTEPLPSIWPLMEQHEWVVCGFGLTAYEASAMGRLVVVLSPTPYHRKLAGRSGFANVRGRPGSGKMKSLIRDPKRVRQASRRPVGGEGGLAQVISGLQPPARIGCPVHAGARGRAVWRGRDRSYFRCPRCGMVYMERYAGGMAAEQYGSSYFFEEYRQQYGRTYLEDFEAIRETGRRRMTIISGLGKGVGSVLDVGCAYGPFLAAAKDAGFTAYGADVSSEAVEYVSRTLGVPVVARPVQELDPAAEWGVPQFDAVTLWYVIEHFPDLDRVLAILARWVRPGGVLALSTPHLRGVSGRRRPDRFFAASPRDHFTIWDRRSAARVLAEYGFHVARTVMTGHHPERYPWVERGILPAALARGHSHLFGRGDTFEVYAKRDEHA